MVLSLDIEGRRSAEDTQAKIGFEGSLKRCTALHGDGDAPETVHSPMNRVE
jgi:hypothetical protein